MLRTKTTSAFLVRALLEADGRKTGLLGTAKSVIGGVEHNVQRTTPEAIDLQRAFREMLDAGDQACVMEVSSHALELRLADAIHFAAAIFTNLTQDHLDFHPTMEDYFRAKRRLFKGPMNPKASIINIDDPYGARLAAELDGPITFALRDPGANYRAIDVQTGLGGSTFTARTRTARSTSDRRCAASSTSTTSSVRSTPRVRSAFPRTRVRRRSPPTARCPAVLRPRTPVSRLRSSWTTRTPRTRWRTS